MGRVGVRRSDGLEIGSRAKCSVVAPEHGDRGRLVVVELLERLRPVLSAQGRLIVRATLPGTRFSLFRFVEESRLRFKGAKPFWRSKERVLEILGNAGFKVELVKPTAHGREETWFIGVKKNPSHLTEN